MQKKQRTYRRELPHYETISRYPEYHRLVEWLATPTPARNPKTLLLLAKELGVHFTTLSRWQAVDGCYEDVRKRIKKELRSDLANVFQALRNKIFKEGNAREIKLFLQWADDFVEKHEIEQKNAIEFNDPEVRKLVSDFESKLKDMIIKKNDGI